VLGSRFFWKLYLTFVALVLVTLAATGFLLHQQLRTSLLADVETRLLDMATSLVPYSTEAFREHQRRFAAGATDGGFDSTLEAQIERMGQQTETRITLVAPDGVVVADSDHDPRTMDNHGTRPEIVASKSHPYGVSRRFSATLERPLLYVAITVRDGDREVGTVRTSIPLVAVDARLAALRNTIAFGAALGMVIALGVGLLVARRITSPLSRMTKVAEALREGHYEQRVRADGADEFALLGSTLDRLADELTNRIATLDEQRAQLGAMVAGLQEGVFAVDEDDNLIFYNRAAQHLLEIGDEVADGDIWQAIGVPELTVLCEEARITGKPTASEFPLARGEATYVIDAHATAFESDGQRGVVAVLHDITSLRRLERMRTEFVANVSHELKTPLTSIRGYVETLIGGAIHDDANNLRFLGKIDQQVDRLTAMVSDVLSLARIEATDHAEVSAVTDWREVVTHVVEGYDEAGKLQRHTCTVETAEDPVIIRGDLESMTQVLDNLLDNAIKYTPQGGTITVRAFNDAGFAVLEVQDTGIGISAIDRQRIFERFFRADRARSRDTGGTGLGLAIVKHLAQGFGGEVRVHSELGRGSCFAVWVPTAEIDVATD
jgi:two-component system phosphate regulon sensor histidine kinase PhoR